MAIQVEQQRGFHCGLREEGLIFPFIMIVLDKRLLSSQGQRCFHKRIVAAGYDRTERQCGEVGVKARLPFAQRIVPLRDLHLQSKILLLREKAL